MFGEGEGMVRVTKVLDTLRSLFENYKLRASTSPVVPTPPLDSGFDNLLDGYESYTPLSCNTRARKSQLNSYLEEDHIGNKAQKDIQS